MKGKLRLALCGFVITALLLGASPALAVPVMPHAFYGTVSIDEADAAVDTVVSAKIGGVDCGSYTVEVVGQYGSLDERDYLVVQGDISNGDTITFYVNGIMLEGQTATFEAGGGPTEKPLALVITDESVTGEVVAPIPAAGGGHVVDASDIADTTITVNTTDEVTITVKKYYSNPHPDASEAELPAGTEMLPRYIDIDVSDADAINWPMYVEQSYTEAEVSGLDESSLGMCYFTDDPLPDGAWHRCSDTGVNEAANYVWANIPEGELPGSPIAVGGTPAPAPEPEPVAPSLVTNAATSVTTSSATLNGNLGSLGTALSVSVSFEWGETSAYGNETTLQAMTSTGAFSFPLSGLASDTTYHFRAKAAGDGTSYGIDRAFTTGTVPTVPPAVTTDPATGVTTTLATLNVSLTDLGTATSVSVSFEWGETSAYGNETTLQAMTSTGAFGSPLSGLASDTTYHFRGKAVGDGTSYGIDRTFTTRARGGGSVSSPAAPPAPPPGTTDVRGQVSDAGVFLESVTTTSEDGLCTLTIPEGTVGLTEELEPLTEMTTLLMDEPPPPPEDAHVIGLAYDLGPDGATFDPPITLTLSYDPDDIPEGIAEEDLVIAYYDQATGEWVELADCVVDTENDSITASAEHFTTFAIIGAVTPPEEEEVAPPEEEEVVPPEEEEVAPPEEEEVAPPEEEEVAPPEEEEEVPEVPAPINWPLIGGIIAGVVVLGLIIFFLVRRRKQFTTQ